MKAGERKEPRFEGGRRRKVDHLAANDIEHVRCDDTALLKKFLSESGLILPARITGLSRKNQRMVARAVKQAREIGLLPFLRVSTGP